jgi:S1-C subfamily serine protease
MLSRLPSLLLLILVLHACASPAEKVSSALAIGDLDVAEAVLRDEGALSASADKLDAELVAARDQFEAAVVSDLRARSLELHASGDLKQVSVEAEIALGRCPWSSELRSMHDVAGTDLAQFTALQQAWRPRVPEIAGSWQVSKQFLAESVEFKRAFLRDMSFRDVVVSACVQDARHFLADIRTTPLQDLSSQFDERMANPGFVSWIPTDEARLLGQRMEILGQILVSTNEDNLIRYLTLDGHDVTLAAWYSEVRDFGHSACELAFGKWIESEIAAQNLFKEPSGNLVEALIFYADSKPEAFSSDCVARSLLGRARALVKADSPSLAAIYFEAAIHSSDSRSEADEEELSLVIDEIATQGLAKIDYALELDVKVPREMFSLVQSVFWDRLAGQGRPAFWEPAASKEEAEVLIRVANAALTIPDFDALSAVSSRYFSHYETVANPRKSYLKSQLNAKDSWVAYCRSSYDSAVRSHNIYPTQWSLNTVNARYSDYQIAVNQYNGLVNQYNATSSTIQRAVYFPYSFHEGEIRYGWTIQLDVEFPAGRREYSINNVLTEFVRLGTNVLDENEGYRTDVLPKRELSTEIIFEALVESVESGLSKMGNDLLPLSINEQFHKTQTRIERAALGVFLDPWIRERASSSDDAGLLDSAARRLRERVASSDQHDLIRLTTGDGGASLQSDWGSAVCRISSGLTDGDWTISSSGAVITPDGFILTCAHGLIGAKHAVKFGENDELVPARLIRIDRERDVALIKVDNVGSTLKFLKIGRDSPSNVGLEVRAIGYPAVISKGHARVETDGRLAGRSDSDTSEMIFDLTVASGSSGCPIIRMDSGEIVAIATAVGAPSLGELTGVASSGYVAVGRSVHSALDALRVTLD